MQNPSQPVLAICDSSPASHIAPVMSPEPPPELHHQPQGHHARDDVCNGAVLPEGGGGCHGAGMMSGCGGQGGQERGEGVCLEFKN